MFNTEYRQNFKDTDLRVNFGFTEGYKSVSNKKLPDQKYFFSKLNKKLLSESNTKSNLELNIQQTNSDNFIKAFGIDTPFGEYDDNILENSLKFDFSDESSFFGLNVSAFENLSLKENKKYEYLLPYITFDKSLDIDDMDYSIFHRIYG